MADIHEVLHRLAEYTALYEFNSRRNIAGNYGTLSDDHPQVLLSAASVWALTCIEKAEIFNQKLILYSRNFEDITSQHNSELWNFLQKSIKQEFNLTIAIGSWDGDFLAPIEPIPYTFEAWEDLVKYLRDIAKSFSQDGYRETCKRIFND